MTEDPSSSSFRKLERNSVSLVDKKPKFEIDLRVERVPQDAILKEEEQMKEINNKLEKFRIGSCTKFIRIDLKKKGDMIFSEESSRVIYEMGNLELIELRQTSATTQCLSLLKCVPEGLNMCLCGFWLRPNQDTMNRIKARFEALITTYYRATFLSRERKHGHNQSQKDNAKAADEKRRAKKRGDHPSILSRRQSDEIYRASQVVIHQTRRRLTAREIGMKT